MDDILFHLSTLLTSANHDKMFSAFVVILTLGVSQSASSTCSIANYPYMVHFWEISSGHLFCEGILISDYWVLTVAHCFYDPTDKTPSNVIVVTGISRLKSRAMDQRIQARLISEIVIDKGFRIFESGMMHNDIAMVKLDRPLYKSNTVNYAELPRRTGDLIPTAGALEASSYVHVTLVDKDDVNDVNDVDDEMECNNGLTIIPKDECEKLPLWTPGRDKPVFSQMICTESHGLKSCERNFGGPLVNNHTEVVGIASLHATECAYLLFTEIEPHLDFIESLLKSSGVSHHFNILLLLLVLCTCLVIM